jgi:hypothetical protein
MNSHRSDALSDYALELARDGPTHEKEIGRQALGARQEFGGAEGKVLPRKQALD